MTALRPATTQADGYRAPADSPLRIVLADDHRLVRRCLRLLLDGEEGIEVVAEAEDHTSVARHMHDQAPHVLVLDLRMPDGSSIEAIRQLRSRAPATQIVVVTMHPSPAFAQRVIDAGAAGMVLKDRADTELPAAVRSAARGEEYVSPRLAGALQARRRAVDGDGLSPRETEVLRLIALGHTNAEIARRLDLSCRTVETHRAKLHRKLGLTTRAQLVHFALRRHMIST